MRMSSLTFFSLTLLFTTHFITGAHAQSSPASQASVKPPFETPAQHALIMDYETGVVLYEKEAHIPMSPSSMSKMMTALMVFDKLKKGELSLDETFPVSEYAWRTGGAASGSSTMFLKVGSRASIEDLLHGVITQSGNDASIALAEGLSGSEEAFARDMEKFAQSLGLKNAHFRNATGLPHPEHKISASDLAELARITIRDYPDYYPFYVLKSFTWNGIKQYNRNPLLGRFKGTDGLKTGHTEEAGYGLTASAEREGKRRIIVLNGLSSEKERTREAERMMRAAFTEFKLYSLFKEGEKVGEANVYSGQVKKLPLITDKAIRPGLHKAERDGMTVSIVYQSPLIAPVQKGDLVAQLVVETPQGTQHSFPLLAGETVERKNFFGRAFDSLITLIRKGS